MTRRSRGDNECACHGETLPPVSGAYHRGAKGGSHDQRDLMSSNGTSGSDSVASPGSRSATSLGFTMNPSSPTRGRSKARCQPLAATCRPDNRRGARRGFVVVEAFHGRPVANSYNVMSTAAPRLCFEPCAGFATSQWDSAGVASQNTFRHINTAGSIVDQQPIARGLSARAARTSASAAGRCRKARAESRRQCRGSCRRAYGYRVGSWHPVWTAPPVGCQKRVLSAGGCQPAIDRSSSATGRTGCVKLPSRRRPHLEAPQNGRPTWFCPAERRCGRRRRVRDWNVNTTPLLLANDCPDSLSPSCAAATVGCKPDLARTLRPRQRYISMQRAARRGSREARQSSDAAAAESVFTFSSRTLRRRPHRLSAGRDPGGPGRSRRPPDGAGGGRASHLHPSDHRGAAPVDRGLTRPPRHAFLAPDLVEPSKLGATIRLDIRTRDEQLLGNCRPTLGPRPSCSGRPLSRSCGRRARSGPSGYGLLITMPSGRVCDECSGTRRPPSPWSWANPAQGSNTPRGAWTSRYTNWRRDGRSKALDYDEPRRAPSPIIRAARRASAGTRLAAARVGDRRFMEPERVVALRLSDWQRYQILKRPFEDIRSRCHGTALRAPV